MVEDVSHASPLALRQYLRVRFLGGRRLKVRESLAAPPFGLVGLGHNHPCVYRWLLGRNRIRGGFRNGRTPPWRAEDWIKERGDEMVSSSSPLIFHRAASLTQQFCREVGDDDWGWDGEIFGWPSTNGSSDWPCPWLSLSTRFSNTEHTSSKARLPPTGSRIIASIITL